VSSLNPAQRGEPNIAGCGGGLAVYWTLTTAADIAAELPNAALHGPTPIGDTAPICNFFMTTKPETPQCSNNAVHENLAF
jgi:hypothetical protein